VYLPWISMRLGLALAYVERGRIEDARRVGAEAVAALGECDGGSEVLVDDGAGLFHLFHDVLAEPDLAAETASRVTASLLERIRLAGESAAVLDHFLDEEDEEFRATLRADFEHTLLAFLAPLREKFGPRIAATSGRPADENLVRICAWCGRVRLHEGWVPLRRFTQEERVGGVTHGMCPDCWTALRPQGGPRP
jgi:hypothetical protein